VQAKGIRTTINKIIAENIPNLKKDIPIQVHEVSRKPNRYEQNRTSSWHIIVGTISSEKKERILKSVREKIQKIYKGKIQKIYQDIFLFPFFSYLIKFWFETSV
jgi:hypothetical protein